MADPVARVQYRTVTFTVAKSTAATAAVSTNFVLGQVDLLGLQLFIPPGHCGFTGFALEYAGGRLLPFQGATDWIIGDDDRLLFDLLFPVDGAVQLRGFNTDIAYAHSFFLRFKVDVLAARDTGGSTPIVPVF